MAEDTMTRAELSEAVYQEVGLSRNESAELVEAVLDEMSDGAVARRDGQDLLLRQLLRAAEGPAHRPQSQDRRGGADPPRRVLVFRASHVLKNRVNGAAS